MIKESISKAVDKLLESDASAKPEFFRSTKYRLPTADEVKDILKNTMTAKEIINGIGYTIIGRGMRSKENVDKIIAFAKLLKDNSSDPKYDEVLKLATEMKPWRP